MQFYLCNFHKKLCFLDFDIVKLKLYNVPQSYENAQRRRYMLQNLRCRLEKFIVSQKTLIKCTALVTAVTVAITALLTLSVRTFKIFDGERIFTVRTMSANVNEALSGLSLKSNSYQIKNTKVSGNNTLVEIGYTFPVYITRGEKTYRVEFLGGTVKEAIKAAGFIVDEYDFVEPSADTVIKKTTYIDYTDIDYVTGSYREVTSHKTDTIYSNGYKNGTVTLKEGTDGITEITYTEKFVNGISAGKTVTSANTVSQLVNAQKIIGTHNPTAGSVLSTSVNCISTLRPTAPIELDANGVPLNYKYKRTARATAYTYTGHNCATGVAPQPGYIAVNPNIIPYGTKMYIKTADGRFIYGYAVAADTGGFVNKYPTGVDLFMASRSECISFGVREVEIYILE